MRWRRISLNLGLVLILTVTVRAGPVMYADYGAFERAVGPGLREIGFETLPDGSPTYWGVDITPEFNYTEQGVTFSSHIPQLEIRGAEGSFYLTTQNPMSWRNWIIADFVPCAWAVGIIFPVGTTLSAFDVDGQLVGSIFGDGSGGGHFLGIVSDVPIITATGDR